MRTHCWRVFSASRELIDDVRMLALTCGVRPGRINTRNVYDNQPLNSPVPFDGTYYSTPLAFSMWDAEGHALISGDHPDPEHIRYERIRAIAHDDERHDVYDVTVEGHGNFVAEGFVVHNSRWHPEDLSGSVVAEDDLLNPRFRTWRRINIPAIAEQGIPDALHREPGEVMESTREGRDKAAFEQTRRVVGDRVWYSMFQGSPKNPAGSLFARAWFEPYADPPLAPIATIVAIDPADTGQGDETGIIAASLTTDGSVVLTEDWSGQFTADAWARRAVTLALTVNAREVAMEAYSGTTTYAAVLARAYRAIHVDALTKRHAGVELSTIEARALHENPPYVVYKWRGAPRIGPVGRSALLRQALETRRARCVEHKLDQFIEDATSWYEGQHQPDRVAAAVIVHDRLAQLGSGRMTMAAPVNERPDPVARLRAIDAPPSRLARRLGR
jgi:hypothetical protein